MKRIRRTISFLFCVLLVFCQISAACAEGYYIPAEAEIPVGGTGTFYLKEAGASDEDPIDTVQADGSGVMHVRFEDPGNYRYEIYSKDAWNSLRYDVLVTVVTGGPDGRELETWVVICEQGSDRKLPAAYYPITVVNPPVSKEMIGGGALGLRTKFLFEFRAVNCTVPELEGKMPMPEGSIGQTKILEIVGPGEVEAGDFLLERAGTYTYEFVERDTREKDFYYDNAVYTVIYDVTEGEKTLEAEMTILKNGAKYTDGKIQFTNYYGTLPDHGPKTGDSFVPTPYLIAIAVSAVAILAIVFFLLRDRRKKNKG